MKAFLSSLALLILIAPARAQRSDLAAADLRIDHKTNPIGIDTPAPHFNWRLTSDRRGVMQAGYRIQVAETERDLRRGRNLVWDTDCVASDQSLHIPFEGGSLAPRQRYYWRVRTWDDAGNASEWSDPAFWEMGLLAPEQWEADWIGPDWDEDPASSPPSPMLRRAFTVSGNVERARLYITALGVYEAHLNGRRVGNDLLTPGWTSYDARLQYQTYDVTDLITRGTNVLGAVLGDGWYRGYIGWGGRRNAYGEDVALLAQLEVTYADGRRQIAVKTDEGWKASTGPIRMSDIYNGEIYDARLEKVGWSTAAYDDGSWEDVRAVDHAKDILIAQQAPDVRRIQTIRPRAILTTPKGDRVVDMGQNMVGWIRLRAAGPRGTEITLRHAEVLDSLGNFYTANLRSAEQKATYILKGGGEEVFEPHFTFQGFRYVAVEGYPGELTPDALEGVVVHSVMEPTGHFETSHALVNQLQHNIVWGQKGNFVDVPTDCPQRDERLGWTGDAQVFAPTAAFNMDVASFFAKWLQDLAADQEEDGRIPHVVPDVLNSGGATGWADAGVIVPWVMYESYGDVRFLETQYESMRAWVDYMRARAGVDGTEYVWESDDHFGDWLAYSSNSPAYPGATTNTDLIATAYFAHSARLVSRAAELLGRSDDARGYAQISDAVTAAFRSEFVTPRGRLTSETQTAYVLALAFDLLDARQREEAARRLAAEVNDRGHLTTGFLGTPHLTHILSEHGQLEAAYKLLLREAYPSWLYPVTMGATTIWERWDGIKPDGSFQDVGMNSFNHYAYGAVGDWLYRVAAGIGSADPGYKKIVIAPRPGGGLTFARARFASPYGTISSAWDRDSTRFELAVQVPPNTSATVRLPYARSADVREGGRPLVEGAGVSEIRVDGDDLVVAVGSGRYAFAFETDRLSGDLVGDDEDDLDDVRAPFSLETSLAELLAHSEARAVIAQRLPRLYDSWWLSQAMGFPLSEASRVIPVDLTEPELEAAEAALARLTP